MSWLCHHAPVSAAHIGQPATQDDIAVVEALLDRPLPADLVAWWRRSCGATGFVQGRLIPGYTPCTVDQAVDHRELMLDIASCQDRAETATLVATPAGSPRTPYWLPVWLPIAHDGGGCNLFIDLRPGPLHGCVMQWDKYEAAGLKPRWPSVATMLAEIAHALQHHTDVDGYQPEALDDGTLDWV
ncbi:SMI1/KNR4 family protein [Phytohabitans sp. ZYX-F-186]|uniref:SMI1/KNR4 family protein n=1 Tax=Phytohabitans maris TaxID=3071409 RepID=A0ABU0ZPK5_9ACTN|nr:SMI1/KNR4 family protein [Phytohabitans sp. ZYX-F-186]MDQ7908289.1 SMI1/KNR4 family protein [Phytohabitans sp. ZYX-F-186]